MDLAVSACPPLPRIVLLVCDPRALYAYWLLGGPSSAGDWPPGELVVRLHDLSAAMQGAWADEVFVDYNCAPGDGGGVLSEVQPERCYQAVLGVRQADGSWHGLARSNRAQTPPGGPSAPDDAHFATLSWDTALGDFVAPEALAVDSLCGLDVPEGWARIPASDPGPPPREGPPQPLVTTKSARGTLCSTSTPSARGEGGVPMAYGAPEDRAPQGRVPQGRVPQGRVPQGGENGWAGNAHVRRAALPLAGYSPLGDAPEEQPTPTTAPPTPAQAEQAPCPDRAVQPLPCYGVPSVPGQRIVSAGAPSRESGERTGDFVPYATSSSHTHSSAHNARRAGVEQEDAPEDARGSAGPAPRGSRR